MSEPSSVVEASLREEYRRMEIPWQLSPFWNEKIPCFPKCRKCRGSRPSCRFGEREQNKNSLNRFVESQTYWHGLDLKQNVSTLHAFWRVGNLYFCKIGMHIDPRFMTNSQKTLVDTALRQSRLQRYIDNICLKPEDVIQGYVNGIFPGLKLSSAQMKVMCPWIDNEFSLLPIPIGAMKKILMTGIALSFLINRLVSNGGDRGEKRLVLFMFHSVFKQTLVRNKFPVLTWKNSISDADFLNAIFQK
jgi:hypothetical protein